jgi:hypothetical protein
MRHEPAFPIARIDHGRCHAGLKALAPSAPGKAMEVSHQHFLNGLGFDVLFHLLPVSNQIEVLHGV